MKVLEGVSYAELTDAAPSIRISTTHPQPCGCADCLWVAFIRDHPEAAGTEIALGAAMDRELLYVPPPALRTLATRHPELDWLCYAPPEQRAWHLDPARLSRLLGLYPHIGDAVWRAILR